jgi:uncharacterized protein
LLFEEPTDSTQTSKWNLKALQERIFRGGFPEPALNKDIDAKLWFASYIQTYLERDVRTLRSVGDLGDFQKLLFALAARSGNLVNFSELGRDLGITSKTMKSWVSVLETSGQVKLVQPYHANIGKRLVKQPKIFFLDTGVLCYLLGIREPAHVLEGIAAGIVFETAVFAELYRLLVNRGEIPEIYFWRTSAGHEIDFVIVKGLKLIPVEAKLTATPTLHNIEALEKFISLFPKYADRGLLVCLCKERLPISRTINSVPLGFF